jgi:hypothetical protein
MRRAPAAALVSVLLIAVGGGLAVASTSIVRSQPNGDIGLIVSVGCGGTDRDRDGDFNTCTNGDEASLLYSVANQSDVTQTIRIDYALDGPGAELDRSFTTEAVVAPDAIADQRDLLRIKKGTPLGDYTLSVTASGSETAATSALFTVHRKNAG